MQILTFTNVITWKNVSPTINMDSEKKLQMDNWWQKNFKNAYEILKNKFK